MTTTDQFPEFDDVGAAVRENRPLRKARNYRFRFALDGLNFRPLLVSDPVPLGRQILSSAGLDPQDELSLFAILPDGDFEDVRLDEPFDLRERGAERFVAFHTDRDFKLTLDDRQLEWGKPIISGAALYRLAKIGKDEAVFLEVRGGEDRLIERDELIDLAEPGIERFITAPKPPDTYEFTLNGRPRVVDDPRLTFEQLTEMVYPGPHGPLVSFSITYRRVASEPHAGELGAGDAIVIRRKGTIVNVTKTDRS